MSSQEEVPAEHQPAADELALLKEEIAKTKGSMQEVVDQLASLDSEVGRINEIANTLLAKDYMSWTNAEKDQFGSHKDLRAYRVALLAKQTQLLSSGRGFERCYQELEFWIHRTASRCTSSTKTVKSSTTILSNLLVPQLFGYVAVGIPPSESAYYSVGASCSSERKIKRKIAELQLPLGSSFGSRKVPRLDDSNSTQSGESFGSNGAGGIHGSDIAQIQYQILNPSYEIDVPPPGCKPAIPNCTTAICRQSGKPVIIKQSQSPREIYFLSKLSSIIQDKRNVTIKPLEMIPSPGTKITFIVFPFLNPLEDVFGRSAQLSRKTWLYLIQQLTEYVAFLHENRVCHRDIKPKNLAINMETLRLVVLDCDLMEEFSDPKKAIVTTFVGTVEYSLPEYVENPARGFNPFDLEMHSLELTCGWMRRRAQASSG
ncbi:kinase-like domain-containing protein [Obelidium mucronatum]|nr:kinase-like domain-containing protein [Obelidium mucronatum]